VSTKNEKRQTVIFNRRLTIGEYVGKLFRWYITSVGTECLSYFSNMLNTPAQ